MADQHGHVSTSSSAATADAGYHLRERSFFNPGDVTEGGSEDIEDPESDSDPVSSEAGELDLQEFGEVQQEEIKKRKKGSYAASPVFSLLCVGSGIVYRIL